MMWKNVLNNPEKKKKYIDYVNEWENKIHAFLEFDPDRRSSDNLSGNGLFAGVPYAVKDNIAVRDFHLTCGSKILKDFVSPYDADVIEKLNLNGAVPVAKCNMDEFGMGSSTDNSALAVTNNPWNTERVSGGSSGGAAAAVASGLVPFAFGSDTGGSVRQPASFCGVYGLKPTYGAVSRHGLVAYASSLDVVGILSRDLSMLSEIFDLIKGQDEKDQTSIEMPPDPPSDLSMDDAVKPVFGYLGGDLGLDKSVAAGYKNCINMLIKQGYTVKEVSIPALEYVVPAYYTIATAEASANLARFDGVTYGYRSKGAQTPLELMKKTRSEGFGDEVKLRILLGTYVLRAGFQDWYYVKAQTLRTKIINDLASIFKTLELLILPAFPTPAFKHGETELTQYQQK
ncbi:MAG: amidase family protein, partial [Spirochaetia bacterium]|nr:amidase family protein [Spirochaetia bacterium]